MNTIDLKKDFFGRKNVLNLLSRRVAGLKEGYRQNVAILGNRFIGKSSVIYKFLADLDDDSVAEIYLDLGNKDVEYLFAKFMGSLLHSYAGFKKLPLQEDLKLLIESTQKFIPQTIEEIKKIRTELAKGKLSESYRGLLSLPEVFTAETGLFCVIILDEFHHLEELGIADVFVELGKKIMTQKKCLYIVTSSLPFAAKKILSEKLSLLFGNFETIYLGPFDLTTSQEFIEHHLGEVKISVSLRNFLTDFTGGYPLYLHLICQEMIALSAFHRQTEVFLSLVTQAIENTVFGPWGVISRHFEFMLQHLCEGKGNRISALIFLAIASGRHKLRDISLYVGGSQKLLLQRLVRLQETGLIVKNGLFYHLDDKLLRYWIKYVYHRRLKAMELSFEKLRLEFRAEVEHSYENFNLAAGQGFMARVIGLLQCFDNEALSINGRKYKLPFFRNIVPVKLDPSSSRPIEMIKGTTSEGDWFIVLDDQSLGEGDLSVFLSESKKISKRPSQRLIISLTDIDPNARLKALEERMWIWNEGELNTLMNIFDQPYIVK